MNKTLFVLAICLFCAVDASRVLVANQPVSVKNVRLEGASWMRLYFVPMLLPEGIVLRMTSEFDGAVQHLSGESLIQWQYSSAFFNGDSVLIELVPTKEHRGISTVDVVLLEVSSDVEAVQEKSEKEADLFSICYNPDTRVMSNDTRSGRYMYGGVNYDGCCTAWMIDDSNNCFLTAGHCTDSGNSIVEFNVPLSSDTGKLQHPGPEDQYVVDQASMQYSSAADWRYFGVFPNSETGLHPVNAYSGGVYRIQRSGNLPSSGTPIEIIGYGENESFPSSHRRVQKHAEGPYSSTSGNAINYRVDTSNGNSGSAVLDLNSGLAIGIHTLGGCRVGSSASYNSGTSIFQSGLQTALANPKGVCAAKN